MNEIKAVCFDIDNTLYDTTLQVEMARRNALRAMIEAGLEIGVDEGLELLAGIVREYGSNYEHHLDVLIRKLGYGKNPRIVAAGIVAYHSTKTAYLVPYPDTIPTLLKLRDKGYLLGVITEGRSVKQWEKLIRLGLQHFFHSVIISEDVGKSKPDAAIFEQASKKMECKPEETVMVGDRIDKDIIGANSAGMTTIQLMKGGYASQVPQNADAEPDYIVGKISEILKILA